MIIYTIRHEQINVLISGHTCTTGCITAYFEGTPEDNKFIKLANKNAEVKVFELELNNSYIL